MAIGEGIISGELAGERSVREQKITRMISYKFQLAINGASRMYIVELNKRNESAVESY